MSVNTNTTPEFATTQESGAHGAPDDVASSASAYAPHPRVLSHWGKVREGKPHGTIKHALFSLEELRQRCETEGAHHAFRQALSDAPSEANESALMLIMGLTLQLSEHFAQAKQDHIGFLRTQLEAYEALADTTPTTF